MPGHQSVIPAEAEIQFRTRVFKWIPAGIYPVLRYGAGMTILVVFFLFQSIAFAQVNLDSINQKVCDRFEEDTARLAAIMEEYRDRNGIKETRVAFGGIDTKVKSADYWITYAAEAIAYQRVQEPGGISGLKSNLQVLAGKILRAKKEVRKVLDE
ncbi:hypothetical protein A3F00_04300 [Candidatus Daviesbacteria bacterium RIFCSPHIGHO2_12_FULL_37_11]|uniref:Uncharacterized protein n=1 Tax=Candidatus Daviesbacteria bacterium RIFCSPHIGHO2_12_FULL_37_11 TaxID=1797777 RepID=A0A1F5K9R4_9BACT|nr:MAG: hypothetical protein A2111_01885 [Candidatus Daviesbacteria bacterium GWA1_38_6]OGE16122.1 MAG: hypothetical protein A2769_03470 [Candidatus Daviesbacteria bacterium RIFCSPHIGHO2_01_FULL_37_27]OGE37646.1 MAG: hypothetical protein A3F00_04300 [Candidatus Daviesbacteria bacterium RIFCSPHIGHO2_12_FULL_37_11]OGE45403.1 MAG: hypothetical protein A3B39_04700 [Candidatus Daviesbacteria bacterium RIFCSPLOWO2_01_FULL_37_10]